MPDARPHCHVRRCITIDWQSESRAFTGQRQCARQEGRAIMRLCKYLGDRGDRADRMVAVATGGLCALLIALACGACGLSRAEPSTATSPVHGVIVFVDESPSI